MSRAASLMLRRGPCDCFIELCAAASAMFALILATATPFLSRCSILDCQIAARHFTEAKHLKYPAQRTKRCFDDLAERTKIVIAWPGDHHPSVSRGIATSRALSRENANFSAFQLILLKISLERANVFTADTERILAVARR